MMVAKSEEIKKRAWRIVIYAQNITEAKRVLCYAGFTDIVVVFMDNARRLYKACFKKIKIDSEV